MWQVVSIASAALLLVFALHRAHLLWLLRRCQPIVPVPNRHTPKVTIQLPLFNEANVAARAIGSLCELDWPRDCLHIQICDDSTDGTAAVVDHAVSQARRLGCSIDVLRRCHRDGFKAGALAAAMVRTNHPFVCVVDADFLLPADFLRRMMPSFNDDNVGMVQARWTHLNRNHNWLTRLQAVFLDAHFTIEHAARAGTGHWFNFNGTAGVWRKRCIDDAGGWQGDTLSEDVDLSYRAQLRGWRFVYRDDVEAPAELPASWGSWLRQQRRWMVGLWQVSWKLLPSLWGGDVRMGVRLEATLHLLSPLASMVTVALLVAGAHNHMMNSSHLPSLGWWLWFVVVTMCIASFFAAGQHRLGLPTGGVWLRMPMLFVVGALLAVSNCWGVLRSMWQTPVFDRTPKRGTQTPQRMAL
jgi:cellulose synthase/poly-beta-1,6-N-acetylglucosamine synthase-like glycosyltransferase